MWDGAEGRMWGAESHRARIEDMVQVRASVERGELERDDQTRAAAAAAF